VTDVIAVVMEQYSVQHCTFIVETFFFLKTLTVVKTQRIFCKHLDVAHHREVLCSSTIQLSVENFRTNASALKNKPPSSEHTAQLPQNTEAVRKSFIISPRHSASRHYVAPGTSYCSVRRFYTRI
jgi:hypothetical protein